MDGLDCCFKHLNPTLSIFLSNVSMHGVSIKFFQVTLDIK